MSVMVNEPIIEQYKAQMAEEIEPQIFEMVQRAESGLAALERKERTLKAKMEAAQTRAKAAQPATTATGAVSSKLEARRLATVTKQLAQTEKELQALTAEIQQLVSHSYWDTQQARSKLSYILQEEQQLMFHKQ